LSRLPIAAFSGLVVATVGAFFVTQHLKVTTPLIAGAPAPIPAVIDPRGPACNGMNRTTSISFYLLHRSDDVSLYVVDETGTIVRTVASGRHMRRGVRVPDGVFSWNGTRDDGSIAPDGTYHFRAALVQQGRTVDLSARTVRVKTTPPKPMVTSVSPSLIPQGRARVRIQYAGNEGRGGTVRIYRTDLPSGPRLGRSFPTPWQGQTALWDGRVNRRPAPQGTYLVGLDVTDGACNTGHFPASMPPAVGSTPHAGVTVRYLAARPPLDPVAAGSMARVYVDSRRRPYGWSLRRAGTNKQVAGGNSGGLELRVPLPRSAAGLYDLSIRSSAHATSVPLVAHGDRAARVLVILPALTWQGLNPVDDDGDGVPDTLSVGGPISLYRPLAAGMPAGVVDEATLLSYLGSSHRPYDLTTDMGLLDGVGPPLSGHAAIVLAGSERWLPPALSGALRSYAEAGGHVVSLGIDSLLRGVTVRTGKALDPTQAASTDALGAHPGALARTSEATVVIRDQLGIFAHTAGALAGFRSYQPMISVTPPSQILSEAGVSETSPSIVGYRLGRGVVVDIGLPGFGASLARNAASQELLSSVWAALVR